MVWVGAGLLLVVVEDAADVVTVDVPCKMFNTAARSVVKVLAGEVVVKAAASLGAVGGEVLV